MVAYTLEPFLRTNVVKPVVPGRNTCDERSLLLQQRDQLIEDLLPRHRLEECLPHDQVVESTRARAGKLQVEGLRRTIGTAERGGVVDCETRLHDILARLWRDDVDLADAQSGYGPDPITRRRSSGMVVKSKPVFQNRAIFASFGVSCF